MRGAASVNKYTDLVQALQKILEKIKEDARKLEEMTNKQTVLQQEKQECTKTIKDSGNLTSDAFDNYKNMATTPKITKTTEDSPAEDQPVTMDQRKEPRSGKHTTRRQTNEAK